MKLGGQPQVEPTTTNQPASSETQGGETPAETKSKSRAGFLTFLLLPFVAVRATFGLLKTMTLTILWAALAVLTLIVGVVGMGVAAKAPSDSPQVAITFGAFLSLFAGFLVVALLDLAKDTVLPWLQARR